MGSVMSTGSRGEQYAYVDPEIQAEKYPCTPGEVRLIACVVINKQRYLFNIRGILPERISALLPGLARIITEQGGIEKLTLIADSRVYTPPKTVEVDGARALYKWLVAASKGKKTDINILSIESKKNPYTPGFIFNGSLEALPGIFPKIQPEHFAALRELRLALRENAENVLYGLAYILSRDGLNNLRAFIIDNVDTGGGDSRFFDNRAKALANVYRALNSEKFHQLEHLDLPLWCEDATREGLAAIKTLYPRLKTLIIHRINSSDTSESGFVQVVLLPILPLIAIDKLFSSKVSLSLAGILQEMVEESQLEILEIHDSRASLEQERREIASYVQQGFLPKLRVMQDWATMKILKLDRIALWDLLTERAKIERYMQKAPGESESVAITAEEEADIRSKLFKDEDEGYLTWLEAMIDDEFPELTHLYYRLLQRNIHTETESQYQEKVEYLLGLIRRAVLEGHLPKFEAFILEGDIPARFADIVHELETSLMRWVFKQKLRQAELGA